MHGCTLDSPWVPTSTNRTSGIPWHWPGRDTATLGGPGMSFGPMQWPEIGHYWQLPLQARNQSVPLYSIRPTVNTLGSSDHIDRPTATNAGRISKESPIQRSSE